MAGIWIDKPYRSLSWTELHRIKRDICYLYHELGEYDGFMGDLNYTEVYSLPYWEYLNISGLPEHEKTFIQTGCLIMILAMAWETLSDAGTYILNDNHIRHCQNALQAIEGNNAQFYRLVDAVTLALNILQENESKLKDEEKKLSEESAWAYREYVLGYFATMAKKRN